MHPIKYLIILIVVFWFLALLQHSFLPHFAFLGGRLNLILVSVFLLNFFETKKAPKDFGIIAGLLGGLVEDLFSPLPFAVFALTFFCLAFFIKKLGALFQRSSVVSCLVIFIFSFFFYRFFSFFLASALGFLLEKKFIPVFDVGLSSLGLGFLYNFILAAAGFLLIKRGLKS